MTRERPLKNDQGKGAQDCSIRLLRLRSGYGETAMTIEGFFAPIMSGLKNDQGEAAQDCSIRLLRLRSGYGETAMTIGGILRPDCIGTQE